MKKTFKNLFCLTFIALCAISLVSCVVSEKSQLKFSKLPELEYVAGSTSQDEFLKEVIVTADNNNYSLAQLKALGATITGIELNQIGTYTLMVNYEGVTLIFEYKVVSEVVATVGEIEYESFIDAWEAANATENSTLTLYKDVNLENLKINDEKVGCLEVETNAIFELNLNGYTIYGLDDTKASSCVIRNNGNWIWTDSYWSRGRI